ncbi:hypothetical protein GCM10009868_38640 [Terrabacter aerolatus]|uniref:VTT domain-containing protein n=1 Tax=Terrabacter aerolatus TaxID=422442 RepID=A0A512D0K7_9MICO|nr:VTT domain-containing protein [Terrabacter aerolatus]GEO30003.1 hypothetical protein TAE01_18130 [Terrabacter aerolatus]
MNGLLLALLTPLGPFALLLLMAVAFAETGLLAGFLLPADTVLVTAGVLVAAGALKLPVGLSVLAVTVAAVAGGQVAYLVGRRIGPRLEQGRTSRFLSPDRLAGARALFERHGARAVVLSRFVPLARTLTPVLAGVVRMDRRTFALHNVLGAAFWTALMLGGGYWLGDIPVVADNLGLILLAILVVSAVPGLVTMVRGRKGSRPAVLAG